MVMGLFWVTAQGFAFTIGVKLRQEVGPPPAPPDLTFLLIWGRNIFLGIAVVVAGIVVVSTLFGLLFGLCYIADHTYCALKARVPKRIPRKRPWSKGLARPSDMPTMRWKHLRSPALAPAPAPAPRRAPSTSSSRVMHVHRGGAMHAHAVGDGEAHTHTAQGVDVVEQIWRE
jgi:hypothetical protein